MNNNIKLKISAIAALIFVGVLAIGMVSWNFANNKIDNEDIANIKFDQIKQIPEDEQNQLKNFSPPETFDSYIIGYENEIPTQLKTLLNDEYDKILKMYKIDKNYDSMIKKIVALNEKLRDNGVMYPYVHIDDLIASSESITETEQSTVREHFKLLTLKESKETDNKLQKTESTVRSILAKQGINYDEALNQMYNQNYQISIYQRKGKSYVLAADRYANSNRLTDKQQKEYANAVEQILQIIPDIVKTHISSIEFNTDGNDNVLAHYVTELENFSENTFRLAFDVNDCFDKDGKLTQDGVETIVHETAHIITLNHMQFKAGIDDNTDPFSVEVYKNSAFLKQFYDKFWGTIIDKYMKQREETGNEQAYYESHMSDFVSDYAAYNPEEDIAETFRVFVFTDKPNGKSQADQKILFLYGFPEFVQLRSEFHVNLGLK